MKIEIVFLIVLTIIIAYIFVLYRVEKMAGDNPSMVDQIKEAVKQIYLADVEAIRNLSAVATKLQADGLTVPAHMNIKGKLNIGSDANAKDFPSWLGLSVDNTEDAHIRLKTKADDKKNVHLINRDGHFRINNPNGDLFGVNQDGHTYNIHTGDHVHHFVGRGENPYITISKEGEWNNKSWYMQNVKNDGDNKIFRIGVHGEGPKLDIHRNGNAFFTGDINIKGRYILAELDRLNARFPDNNTIDLTNGRIVQGGDYFHFTGPNGKGSKQIAASHCYCSWPGWN